MIITGGRLRGRQIVAPSGDSVRPTPSRVREALFSILAPRLEGARVLDCFAGSGGLGLESLSRGASYVTFIEAHGRTAGQLRKTLQALQIESSEAQIITSKAEQAITRVPGIYDIILADPPYAQPPPMQLMTALLEAGKLSPNVIIVYEHHGDRQAFESAPFVLTDRRRWGEVGMSFLARADESKLTS